MNLNEKSSIFSGKRREGHILISQEDRKILAEFSERIRRILPSAKVWAFGSRARGVATWESDLDTCIVLNRVDEIIDRQIRDIAWEVGFENDRVITTVVFDSEQFERGPMSESTLVANILQEGIAA
jgi:predicted nucleotidyltransferase